MTKFIKTAFLALLFAVAIVGLSAGTAEAMHSSYYEPYYYGGGSSYSWNRAYVNGYDPYAYSYGYRDNSYRNDYYVPRVSGYDPYAWDERNFNNNDYYRSRDYGSYRDRDYRRNDRRNTYNYDDYRY